MDKDKNILTREKDSAECPHCSTLCHWDWLEFGGDYLSFQFREDDYAKIIFAQCKNCEQDVLFYKDILVFPLAKKDKINVDRFKNYPLALKLFNEACSIIELSPRAALTLAKMCLETLIKEILRDNQMRSNTFLENVNTLVDENIIDENIKNLITDIRIIGNQGAPVFNIIDTTIPVLSEDAAIVLKIVTHITKTITEHEKLKDDLISKM